MYKQVKNMNNLICDWVIRLSDGALIQIENKEYLKWLDEGNQPLPPDEGV